MGSRVHTTPGSLQRSRSDIDVNAASSAKSRLSTVPASSPFSSAAALPPGSYASLGNCQSSRPNLKQSPGYLNGCKKSSCHLGDEKMKFIYFQKRSPTLQKRSSLCLRALLLMFSWVPQPLILGQTPVGLFLMPLSGFRVVG